MMANKKTKELPMEFNPALDKYEPVLPIRKGKGIYLKNRRINWWMIASLSIIFLILIITLIINLSNK